MYQFHQNPFNSSISEVNAYMPLVGNESDYFSSNLYDSKPIKSNDNPVLKFIIFLLITTTIGILIRKYWKSHILIWLEQKGLDKSKK